MKETTIQEIISIWKTGESVFIAATSMINGGRFEWRPILENQEIVEIGVYGRGPGWSDQQENFYGLEEAIHLLKKHHKKCDFVYMCDNCGKEREREYKLKICTPETPYKKDNPEFCSIKCMREWLIDSEKPKSVENDPIIQDEEFDRYEGGKTYSIMNLKLEQWRELLNGKTTQA